MARMTPPAALAALAVALLLGLAPAARAGLILQAASASTNMGTARGSPNNTRNQSGLSHGYTSLVTDFDAYVASDPTHNGTISNERIWFSASGTLTGNFDFALGGTFTIESFALWNLGEFAIANVRGFELLADDDATFDSPTSLGNFTVNFSGHGDDALPAVFTFAPTSAQFVRMRITSNNGSSSFTGFGEAAFEVQSSPTAVPEPASLTLLATGGLCLLGYARRRKTQAA